MQETLTGILSKIVNNQKKEIIVAENIFGNTLFLPVPIIGKLFTTSFELNKFSFQTKHHEELKISISELERIEQNLVTTLNLDTKADPKGTMERLIAENLMTSSDINVKYGHQIEVIAQEKLTAIKVIILYYPEYLLVKSNYLPIRGGNKLFEEVTLRTKEQFKGVVPGRWKWNLGNWAKRQAAAKAAQTEPKIQSSDIQLSQTTLDPLEKMSEESTNSTEEYRNEADTTRGLEMQKPEVSNDSVQQEASDELSVANYDDFFN